MARKKAARSVPAVTGFTAIPSGRLTRLYNLKLVDVMTECKGLTKEQMELRGLPATVEAAQAEAKKRVVKGLPSERMVRSTVVKPSKSDDPKYRK